MNKNMRTFFSVCALILIAVFVMRLRADMWTTVNWLMLAISAVVCVLVFRCFVFVFNFSYALACLLNGSLIALTSQNLAGYLLGGLMAAYGLRLFVFSWVRTHGDSYSGRMERIQQDHSKTPVAVQAILWLQCTAVYTFHLFGIYIAGQQGLLTTSVLLGAVIIFAGLILETVADMHKQSAKNSRPDAFVRSGLYTRWRHPNFVGEIVVQLGIIVVGLSAVASTWGNLAAVLTTPAYIVILMLYQSWHADQNMQQKYGDQPEFQTYIKNSGGVLPRF